MATVSQRIVGRLRRMAQGHVRNRKLFQNAVTEKRGLEIGGPSPVFRRKDPVDIYRNVGALDNCDFSKSTVWAEQQETFSFDPGKAPRKSIFCDGSNLDSVADNTYDFVLSSHNLEHFANPVKALYEWKRAMRLYGALILVIPHYKRTFDHRRTPTSIDHMLEDLKIRWEKTT